LGVSVFQKADKHNRRGGFLKNVQAVQYLRAGRQVFFGWWSTIKPPETTTKKKMPFPCPPVGGHP
jgi:hypothetical protein